MKIKGHSFFQHSIFSALMSGDLSGSIKTMELLKQGSLGLGTFNATDGELIILDGKGYQILASGDVNVINSQMTSPFASVTNFVADLQLTFNNVEFSELKKQLEQKFPSLNIFYALKIKGSFEKIGTRTLTKQKEPFVTLKEAAKNQSELVLKNLSGDIVAFWGPSFANMMLVPGFHAHFISSDKKTGGHVLDFKAKSIIVEICYLTNFNLSLPLTESYLKHKVDAMSMQDDIKKVESESQK